MVTGAGIVTGACRSLKGQPRLARWLAGGQLALVVGKDLTTDAASVGTKTAQQLGQTVGPADRDPGAIAPTAADAAQPVRLAIVEVEFYLPQPLGPRRFAGFGDGGAVEMAQHGGSLSSGSDSYWPGMAPPCDNIMSFVLSIANGRRHALSLSAGMLDLNRTALCPTSPSCQPPDNLGTVADYGRVTW